MAGVGGALPFLGLIFFVSEWGTVDLCVDLPKFWFENDGMVS